MPAGAQLLGQLRLLRPAEIRVAKDEVPVEDAAGGIDELALALTERAEGAGIQALRRNGVESVVRRFKRNVSPAACGTDVVSSVAIVPILLKVFSATGKM